NCTRPNDRPLNTNLNLKSKISDEFRARGRILCNPDRVGTVGHAIEQEEAIQVGPRGGNHFASCVNELEIETFEAQFRALDHGALDIASADERDLDFGRNTGTRN